MSRDHRRLRVVRDAHALTLAIYEQTLHSPRDEWYGLRHQMRHAAVSIPTNIVEGSARRTAKDYCHLLNIALGSACELAYLVSLATELDFVNSAATDLSGRCDAVIRQLQRLVNQIDLLAGTTQSERSFGDQKTNVRSL